jgi:hypothetical protein
MDFQPKLDQMRDRAFRDGNAELSRNIDSLAKLLASVLRDERWDSLTKADWRQLGDALLHAREGGRLFDAALCIRDRILSARNSYVHDVRLSKNLDETQNEISDAFENELVPRRGFVYVAWRKTPEKYVYVGKAKSADRLNLRQHGPLAVATQHATSLSLLFPTQSREDILFGVEASIIELVFHQTGSLPELNKRREKVPEAEGSKRLEALSGFLGMIADDLEKKF